MSYFRDSSGRDKVGLFRRFFKKTPRPSTPSAPKPSKPSTSKAPTPHYDFPLGSGRYFGPKGGPDASVSGYYGRRFKGETDRTWLQRWGSQMGKRGWNLRKHLPSGNDGYYGPEYRGLVKAFQKDQGLLVDGKLGPRTWRAAFENPVT
ncbi:peptidoglycan-binding protein [Glycomyces paridis]|uniref:Peptidoglycan-binding protein n=1 Tax=Glycomyces paridis TaxID=2126555 RepID=A0A4S8P8S6_9ACTN|nr:peptidoglycan-binding protein [Glycomyces paridis]